MFHVPARVRLIESVYRGFTQTSATDRSNCSSCAQQSKIHLILVSEQQNVLSYVKILQNGFKDRCVKLLSYTRDILHSRPHSHSMFCTKQPFFFCGVRKQICPSDCRFSYFVNKNVIRSSCDSSCIVVTLPQLQKGGGGGTFSDQFVKCKEHKKI